ncbi:hypothetical protein LSM04_008929 [Trypanosoma melophagium]|uniref:uncharacterized protein n=1 Tax=Trypanosoma melophagium TaxID=715481 RepID=UPI00351A33EA|nr:hypothetical protein LSM04_008929 [Trypanosoma melophagium]
MTASFYDGLRASRTIKKVQLPMADIQRAVEIGKFERVPNFVDPHRGFQLAETTQPPVECRGNAPTENNDVVTTPTTHTTPGHRDELRTLPTGARWSVAVGQAVTWTIVDIDTRCTILTMTENILIAAPAGEEAELVQTVRQIVDRIEVANLCTSPSREELRSWSDRAMLEEGTRGNVFLGEEFAWIDGE